MMQDTTQKKQVMGSGNARLKAGPDDDAVVAHFGDEATVEDGTTVEGEEDVLADDTQGDHSTVSTGWSHDEDISHPRASPLLEAETDPTSMPSGILDDLELERKYTGSPLDSLEAVHGSDSANSETSDSPTGDSNSRECVPTAVNPGKVKAIGDHFGESHTETSTPRFHDPSDSWEALHIKNKIKQANDTMDDIALNPEARFRDPGTSFQVSAQPEEHTENAIGVGCDIVHKRKVQFAPDSLLHTNIEGPNERRRRRSFSCCIIL